MALSGSVSTTSYDGRYLTCTWSATQSIVNNTSTISWTLKGAGTGGSSWYYSGPIWIGFENVGGGNIWSNTYWTSRQKLYNGTVVASGSFTITHNNDGTRQFRIFIEGAIYTNAYNVNGNTTVTLDQIPRYANPVPTLSARTETSLTVAWTADGTVDQLQYSTNNGSTWSTATNPNASSGSFTVSGLSANTSYNVKLKARRKDSQLTNESDTVSMATYSYPYASTMPNFTIGNAVSIALFNPLGRNVTVNLRTNGGTSCATGTTSGTSISLTGTASTLYASIPNATSATYSVRVTYSGQNQDKTGGTYSVNTSTSTPTIGTFTYADNNNTAVGITGDNQKIVQNVSTPLYSLGTLASRNSATLASAKIVVNGATITKSLSGSSTSTTMQGAVINSTSNVTATLTVTDSRGLTATKTVNVQMVAWNQPSAIITTERVSNFYSETDVTVDASYTQIGSSTVTINLTGKAVPITGKTTPSDVTATLTDNVTTQLSFDNEFEWNLTIVLTDSFGGTTTYQAFLSRGIPFVFFDRKRNSVGINQFPQNDNALEVDGAINTTGVIKSTYNGTTAFLSEHGTANQNVSFKARRTDTNVGVWLGIGSGGTNHGVYSDKLSKWMLYGDASRVHINVDAIYPVGSIYMSVNNTNPATYFGGTWEQIKDTFLLACGTTYANGATGGEATHTLTTSEIPSHTHYQQYQSSTSYVGVHVKNYNTGGSINGVQPSNGTRRDGIADGGTRVPTVATGGGGSHNNMPPYLAVYVWKRTA